MPHFTMLPVSGEGERRSWRQRLRKADRALLVLARTVPYGLWLFLVLAPVGLIAYGLASVAAAVWSNLRTGWNDHK